MIDDDADNCEMMPLIINCGNSDYDIVTCDNPIVARTLLATEHFDLLILDYVMPGITGPDFCKEIRGANSNIPVIFYTAMASPDSRMKAIEAGADRYLTKPTDMDQICTVVEEIIRNGRYHVA
jgi:two-component system OmpR family response regulator